MHVSECLKELVYNATAEAAWLGGYDAILPTAFTASGLAGAVTVIEGWVD